MKIIEMRCCRKHIVLQLMNSRYINFNNNNDINNNNSNK